jgi:hypothetical protein
MYTVVRVPWFPAAGVASHGEPEAAESGPGEEVGGVGGGVAPGHLPCTLLHLFHCDRAENIGSGNTAIVTTLLR